MAADGHFLASLRNALLGTPQGTTPASPAPLLLLDVLFAALAIASLIDDFLCYSPEQPEID